MFRDIIIEILEKLKNVKVSRDISCISYRGTTMDFSSETTEGREKWHNILRC